MRYRLILAALLAGGCLTAAPAFAQPGANDISVDPTSPAGVEYELPLNAARADAAGTQAPTAGATPSAGRAAPLFGAGAQPDAPAKTASGAKGKREAGEASSVVVTAGSGDASVATGVAAGDGSFSGATIALGALLVLLAGGVIGLVLRRPAHR